MPWDELLLALLVCHLVGDFALQTEWQALHKKGGLGRDRERRRALALHIATYTLAFVPVLALAASGVGEAVAMAAAIAVPHAVQDDGRLIAAYDRRVKGMDPVADWVVALFVDQTFHVLALTALAVAVAGG